MRNVLVISRSTKLKQLHLDVSESYDLKVVGHIHEVDQVIESCFELRPQIILVDFVKPGKFGPSVLTELTKLRPDAVIVAVSTDNRIKRALDLGADDYVMYPNEIKNLSARISTLADDANIVC